MNFAEYQKQADTTAVYPKDNEFMRVGYPILGLNGEAGEVAEVLKKTWRDHGEITDKSVNKIHAELGDVLWYIAQTCTEFGLSMEEVAITNLKKLSDRKNRDKLHGSGDDR